MWGHDTKVIKHWADVSCAYLSPSSRWTDRVWSTAVCAGSRSLRSWWAEAAEGRWSLPVGVTHGEVTTHGSHTHAQRCSAFANTSVWTRTAKSTFTFTNTRVERQATDLKGRHTRPRLSLCEIYYHCYLRLHNKALQLFPRVFSAPKL